MEISEEAEVLFLNFDGENLIHFPLRKRDFQKRRRCSFIYQTVIVILFLKEIEIFKGGGGALL